MGERGGARGEGDLEKSMKNPPGSRRVQFIQWLGSDQLNVLQVFHGVGLVFPGLEAWTVSEDKG